MVWSFPCFARLRRRKITRLFSVSCEGQAADTHVGSLADVLFVLLRPSEIYPIAAILNQVKGILDGLLKIESHLTDISIPQ